MLKMYTTVFVNFPIRCLIFRMYGSDKMRRIFSITVALMILLSLTTSVQALESKTLQRDNGGSAWASWSKTNGTLITDTYLSLSQSSDGTDIYLSTNTWDTTTGFTVDSKSGYLFTNDDVFTIDSKLNFASLSEVSINVYNWYDWYTPEIETLKITADWVGTGEVQKGSSTYTSTDGDYRFKSTSNSNYRNAMATGSVNNIDLGQNNGGSLYKFKSAFIEMEK